MPILSITGWAHPDPDDEIPMLPWLRDQLVATVVGLEELELTPDDVSIDFVCTGMPTDLKCVVMGLFHHPPGKAPRGRVVRERLAHAIAEVLKVYARRLRLAVGEVLVPHYIDDKSGYVRFNLSPPSDGSSS